MIPDDLGWYMLMHDEAKAEDGAGNGNGDGDGDLGGDVEWFNMIHDDSTLVYVGNCHSVSFANLPSQALQLTPHDFEGTQRFVQIQLHRVTRHMSQVDTREQ